MSERLKALEKLKKPKSLVAVVLASTALAGCGNTMSADDWAVGECGSHDYRRAGASAVEGSVKSIISTAKNNVLELQERALNSGGSIDLGRYPGPASGNEGDVVEINASQDKLTLSFDRSGAFTSPRVDHVDFPIEGDKAQISQGAVVCFNEDSQLVTTGTFDSLQEYVNQTAALGK